MNDIQALTFLYHQFKNAQTQGLPSCFSLEKIQTLCQYLHHPQHHLKTVHIAGTNGKGSTAHALAAVLQTAGYKTGLFTSPHIHCFRERIRVNGIKMEKKFLANFITQHQHFLQKIQPSLFEISVMMAFAYFLEKKIDIAMVEVGMGGRLDATNILCPVLSVITNISKDHTAFLGNTLEKIAQEKAGIIKNKIPVIIGESIPNTKTVFQRIAKKKNAPLFFAEKYYAVSSLDNQQWKLLHKETKNIYTVTLEATGYYQKKNLPAIFLAIDLLKKKNYTITHQHILEGLKNMNTLTKLKGRWIILQKNPMIIADIAHNVAGIHMVMQQINKIPHQKLHIVWGMVQEKSTDIIFQKLPREALYYFCMPNIPRAMPLNILSAHAEKYQYQKQTYATVAQALHAAKTKAHTQDLVLITGSTFVVSEALQSFFI